MSEEFKLVKRRKNRKGKRVLHKYLQQLNINQTELTDYTSIISRIEEEKTQFLGSNEFQDINRSLNDYFDNLNDVTLVCFGLGKISECPIARCQFGVLLALKDCSRGVLVYDPIFSSADVDLLKHFNCKLLEANTEGKFPVNDNPTIFYLPHCPKQLTNNLLYSNWNENLIKCAIICNSFQNLLERTPKRLLQPSADYILKISPFVTETPLKISPPYSTTLNDTSIHTFPKIASLPSTFWSDPERPEYPEDDTEFVTSLSSGTDGDGRPYDAASDCA